MKVAYLGMGLMGEPMAANLVRAGHDVRVWNRSPERTERVGALGAHVAHTPAEATRDAEVICTCLPDGSVVGDVLFGGDLDAEPSALGSPDQVETGSGTRPVVVDHSTIDPADARSLARRCEDAGADYLDAPVSGGPHGAEAGTLAVFVGGRAEALERARPALEAYGGRIVHIGASGTGQVAKLANQMAIAGAFVGLAEGFATAESEGVDPERLFEVLSAATADSQMLRTRAPVAGLQPGMPASSDWEPGFAADFMAKDLDFALQTASEHDIDAHVTRLTRDLLERARKESAGDRDWTIISRYIGAQGGDDSGA